MLYQTSVCFLAAIISCSYAQTSPDNLGLSSGYNSFSTSNFDIQILKDSQILSSLKTHGGSFDFLPNDYLSQRARNGQYHWGDVTYRYRLSSSKSWIDGDSSVSRSPVASSPPGAKVFASANLRPTIPSNTPLNITREWINVNDDLALQFTITNTGSSPLELGSLGFPAEFNSIFSGRTAEDIQAKCSLTDPYIGMHAGYLRISPVSGNGPALIVTPLGDTPLEAWRNLAEGSYAPTYYGSQTFEGFYEWQVLSKAWAEKEWNAVKPWNDARSVVLQPGKKTVFGLRFSLAKDGIRGIEAAVKATKIPFVAGVPGFILPRDLPGKLSVTSNTSISNIAVVPSGALSVVSTAAGQYTVTAADSAFGRARLTITYSDNRIQTVHYYIIKSASQSIADLGKFSTTSQWYTDKTDPFGRAPSVMTYDYEAQKIVTQDDRAWVAGLSDEAGAGSYLAAAMKQVALPNADEISKLETFVDEVLFKTIQLKDFSVRKSLFFYQPDAVPGYPYDNINWSGTWNKEASYLIDRAYNYVHVAAAYWALYRVGRAYPDMVKHHDWAWYLNQSYQTVTRCMARDGNGNPTVGYSQVGLMGETVFGELLKDLKREGKTAEAASLEASMRQRAVQWDQEAVPFGSEMAWDSTGQEGVYYWTKHFGFANTAKKALGTVLGFQPTVAHWGWNGNARRYWDNIYGGKLRRIERQLHHYGSGLNALILLSAFRSDPTDTYLLQAGYGGMNGPLSNINSDGFAAASFHSFPDTLKWDGISGDYGPNFVGLALGSATYLVKDANAGLTAYGGILTQSGTISKVVPKDAIRRKVFIAPLGLLVEIDAGVIRDFSYDSSTKTVSFTLGTLENSPSAAAANVWVETTVGSAQYKVTSQATKSRAGWRVPLNSALKIGLA